MKNENLDPQKSSAAQFLTYIASKGVVDEKYEIRYENENIWMSQKMLAGVYGYEFMSGITNSKDFSQVIPDHGTVMWADGTDLCPDDLYYNCVK